MRPRAQAWATQYFMPWRPFYLGLVVVSVWVGIVSNASIASGAQWSVEPTFRSEGEFDDNLRLTTLPHHNTWAMKVSPRVRLNYATEILTLKADPQYEYVRYYSDDPIDETFNNYFFPLSGIYRTEVDRLGLDVTLKRDNALRGELEESGVATRLIPRNSGKFGGSWDRSVTERMTLQSNYQYTDVNYERNSGSNLRDYYVHAGKLGVDYQWSEELHVHGNVSYANYFVSSEGLRAQGPGFELGFSQRMFETFSISSSGGLRYVRTTLDQNGQRQKDTDLTVLFNLSVDKKWERSHVTVGYSRTLTPSGLGVLFVNDRVKLGVNHQLTHALKASLRGTFTNNDRIGSSSDVSGVNDSRYFRVGPAVSWRVTEYWSWDLSYGYARFKRKGSSGGTAHSNEVTMGLTYTWPKWVFSP